MSYQKMAAGLPVTRRFQPVTEEGNEQGKDKRKKVGKVCVNKGGGIASQLLPSFLSEMRPRHQCLFTPTAE